MWHSVIDIGNRRERISEKRKDIKRFNGKEFYKFAEKNVDKYQLLFEYGNLKVNTWNSSKLIEDYLLTIN